MIVTIDIMDIVGLILTGILLLGVFCSLIFAGIADRYEKRELKRSEEFWKDKEE